MHAHRKVFGLNIGTGEAVTPAVNTLLVIYEWKAYKHNTHNTNHSRHHLWIRAHIHTHQMYVRITVEKQTTQNHDVALNTSCAWRGARVCSKHETPLSNQITTT